MRTPSEIVSDYASTRVERAWIEEREQKLLNELKATPEYKSLSAREWNETYGQVLQRAEVLPRAMVNGQDVPEDLWDRCLRAGHVGKVELNALDPGLPECIEALIQHDDKAVRVTADLRGFGEEANGRDVAKLVRPLSRVTLNAGLQRLFRRSVGLGASASAVLDLETTDSLRYQAKKVER